MITAIGYMKMSYQYMGIPDDANLETVEYAMIMAWKIIALPFEQLLERMNFLL